MRFASALLSRLAAVVLAACASPPPASAPRVEIDVTDVALFYEVFDAAGGAPAAEALEAGYLQKGSEGLRTFAAQRRTTGQRIADAIAETPELYVKARDCAKNLPEVEARLETSLSALAAYDPDTEFPAVTIAVGRGRPVGIGDPATGVQIGLEALCAASFLNPDLEDRFVYVITHEYVHVLQNPALGSAETPTVLEASLLEGIAEFVTEQAAGQVAYGHLNALTSGREREIETAFLAEANDVDLSNWLYNMGKAEPADLGYWVGYRIAKAYYLKSPDKRAAIRDMLDVSDAEEFLAASGWYPGIILE